MEIFKGGGPNAPPTLDGTRALALLHELVDQNMILNAEMASGWTYPNIKVEIPVEWITRAATLLRRD